MHELRESVLYTCSPKTFRINLQQLCCHYSIYFENIYESLVCQGVLQWDKEKIKRIVEGDEMIDDDEDDEFEDDGDSIL